MILICLHTAMESAARNNWASDKHQSRIGTTQQEQDPVECQQVQRATAWAERFQRLLCQQRGVRGIQTGTRLSWPPARPISSAACRRPGALASSLWASPFTRLMFYGASLWFGCKSSLPVEQFYYPLTSTENTPFWIWTISQAFAQCPEKQGLAGVLT